jgi:hypothetical protein
MKLQSAKQPKTNRLHSRQLSNRSNSFFNLWTIQDILRIFGTIADEWGILRRLGHFGTIRDVTCEQSKLQTEKSTLNNLRKICSTANKHQTEL